MTKHEWHDRDENGEARYFRACHHAGKWEFFSTLKSDPEWQKHDSFPLEVMEAFRDVLWKKHQRRRVPLKQVEQIDEMIAALRSEAGFEGEEA